MGKQLRVIAGGPDDVGDRSGTALAGGTPPRMSLAMGLLKEARPKQWPKNVLVFAAPGAAGALTEGPTFVRAVVAFIAFCLVASGTYYLNDSADVESDRRHPKKRFRPIAAGVIPVPLAIGVGIGLLIVGFGVSFTLGWRFAAVVAGYCALTTSYSIWLKHVAVLDIAVVAAGFVIRAVAGGVATDVPISEWFLIVASFGSLFIVTGKRHGEHLDLGDEGASMRATLGEYSIGYLRYVWMTSSAVAITAYCLWAFEQQALREGFAWYQLSIVPFVLAMLRYALLLESGKGSAPEDIVLGDRPLQLLGLIWMIVFLCGVELGR